MTDTELELFLKDHDPLWDTLPTKWQEAPFIGNGLSGALAFFDLENNCIKWFIGRSDIGKLDYPGKARNSIRRQLGSILQVFPEGIRISGCRLRLDLWNAQISGTIETDKGEIRLRAFAPSGSASIIVESDCTSPDLKWEWKCGIKPEGVLTVETDHSLFVAEDFVSHPRTEVASGGFAVAWGERRTGKSSGRFVCSIGSTPVNRRLWNEADSGISAREEAETDFRKYSGEAPENTIREHRRWWHNFYHRSFFSFSNIELESLYWIQLYKFASSTRPDRPMIDNHGIWSTNGTYGFATWDYNVQATYRLHLTANMADFGKPLLKFLDDNFNSESMWDAEHCEYRAGMRQQTFLRYRFFDRELWEHGKDLPCEGPAKFLWGVHNYIMHYRHQPDGKMMPRFLLMLEAGINAMLAGMRLEDDGYYHIPNGCSWEAWHGKDPSGLLAVMKWALATAIEYSGTGAADSIKTAKWRETLEKIAPYHKNENGYMLGNGQEPILHRHWTHLMMLYPLDICEHRDAIENETLKKSIDFWANISAGLNGSMPDALFACPAAIALYAYLKAGCKTTDISIIPKIADNFLYRDTLRNPGLWPSTMHSEWTGPVIETPIFMASVIQECFLQSRKDGIHVFPSVPDDWPDAIFSDWHAEGNFLISAMRKDGRTEWVSIESLSGQPVKLHTDMPLNEIHWNGVKRNTVSGKHRILNDYVLELHLKKGGKLILSKDKSPDIRIKPVPKIAGLPNSFGLNKNFFRKRPDFEEKVRKLIARIHEWDQTIPPGANPFSP